MNLDPGSNISSAFHFMPGKMFEERERKKKIRIINELANFTAKFYFEKAKKFQREFKIEKRIENSRVSLGKCI